MKHSSPDNLRASLYVALTTVPRSLFRDLGAKHSPLERDELRRKLVDEYLLPERDNWGFDIMQNFGDCAPINRQRP